MQGCNMFGACNTSLIWQPPEPIQEVPRYVHGGTFRLSGLSPEAFIKQYNGVSDDADISILVTHFRRFCFDFEEAITSTTPSFATEFCNKIIFEVGPESKFKTTTENNVEWRFEFPVRNNPIAKRTVLVCKDKSTHAKCQDNILVLTVTQASLLALLTFGRITELSVRRPDPVYLLTPLAAAIFPKENLNKLLNVIRMLDPSIDMARLLKIINASCQPGGQCLPESRADCAAVASIIATRHMKSKPFQHESIRKTLKKYLNIGKIIEKTNFELYSKFASQEIPPDLNYNSLLKIIKQ